jgi:hypothetical protein
MRLRGSGFALPVAMMSVVLWALGGPVVAGEATDQIRGRSPPHSWMICSRSGALAGEERLEPGVIVAPSAPSQARPSPRTRYGRQPPSRRPRFVW